LLLVEVLVVDMDILQVVVVPVVYLQGIQLVYH
jgi:hypothetical protein